MEHKVSTSIEEQLNLVMAIKTEIEMAATFTAHIENDVYLKHLKQEPKLFQNLKREPALLVKEEILEDSSQAGNEQQCVQGTTRPAGTGRVNEDRRTSLRYLLNVKHELEGMDIGPTVLQHMDIHSAINMNMVMTGAGKNTIVDDCRKAMPCSGVKNESLEDKLRGFITPQKETMNEQIARSTLQNLQLAVLGDQFKSICRVHLIRLDTFQCDLCDEVCTDKHCLVQHVKSLHRSSLQTSLLVKFRKANKHESATEHKRLHVRNSKPSVTTGSAVVGPSHTGERSYQCTTCDARLANSTSLSNHMRIHTGVKPYQCTTCDARFACSSSLTRHIRVHTGEKPYQCTTCDSRFADISGITKHMRVHTGEKPYQCTTCDARFTQRIHLTRHMRIHMGEKPYQWLTCDVRCKCGAKFARKGNLKSHIRRCHPI